MAHRSSGGGRLTAHVSSRPRNPVAAVLAMPPFSCPFWPPFWRHPVRQSHRPLGPPFEARCPKLAARHRPGLMMCLAVAMLWTAEAGADDDVELARRLREQGRILPLEQLLSRAQELRAGIPVEVELHTEGERHAFVYEIEMLDRNGDVWSIVFDAETGALVHLDADED